MFKKLIESFLSLVCRQRIDSIHRCQAVPDKSVAYIRPEPLNQRTKDLHLFWTWHLIFMLVRKGNIEPLPTLIRTFVCHHHGNRNTIVVSRSIFVFPKTCHEAFRPRKLKFIAKTRGII